MARYCSMQGPPGARSNLRSNALPVSFLDPTSQDSDASCDASHPPLACDILT